MVLEKGELNGIEIIQQSSAPDIPVSDVSQDGGDVISQNAAQLALRRSPTVVNTEADLLTWATLVDGNTYQTLGYEAVDDGGAKLYTYHLTGRPTAAPEVNRTYWIPGPPAGNGTDYFIDVKLEDRWQESPVDISPLVQAILDMNEAVRIPAGYFRWNSTVTTPYKSGITIEGAGRSEVTIGASTGALAGYSTRIRWNATGGSTGSPLVVRGSQANISGLAFLGAGYAPGPAPARYTLAPCMLIESLHPGSPAPGGLGAGKHDISGCGWYSFETAIQVGNDELEVSNDMITFRRTAFRNCGQCIWVRNRMSMECRVYAAEFRLECEYGIRVSAGGHWEVMNSFVGGPITILYFDGTAARANRTGVNNKFWRVDNTKVDTQATDGVLSGDFHLTEASNSNGADIIFSNTSVGNNENTAPGGAVWSEGIFSDQGSFTSINPNYVSPNVTLAVATDVPD